MHNSRQTFIQLLLEMGLDFDLTYDPRRPAGQTLVQGQMDTPLQGKMDIYNRGGDGMTVTILRVPDSLKGDVFVRPLKI